MSRFKHNLSFFNNTSMNMGALTPIGCTEVLMGDTIQQATKSLIRLSPLVAPVMHPVHTKIHHFYIPYRIIWEDFEDFITKGEDGISAPSWPTIDFTTVAAGSLAHMLGVPTNAAGNMPPVSALPFRAYALVFNEYFRDQDLIEEVDIDFSSGPDTTTNTALLTAAWEKDRYTSSRPFTQKGPEVSIPLTGNAPVTINRVNNAPAWSAQNAGTNTNSGTGNLSLSAATLTLGAQPLSWNPNGGLAGVANLSGLSAVDMNDLRAAMALQRWQEARAMFGSRYTEYLRYYGIKSSDARLQRPEYLGGGKSTIQFSEVLGSVNNDDTTLGELGGHGIANLHSNRYRHFFEEHGIIISFMTIRPVAVYADGLPRYMHARTNTDIWQREMEHIGQQAILNKEVYALHAQPDATFGYNDRYGEYREGVNRVTGEFATILKDWNLARLFASSPALNADFVNCIPDPRIFASSDTDQFRCMIRHSIQARRLVGPGGKNYIY